MREVKIGILVYEQCTASMILGVLDILSVANIQSKSKNGDTLFSIEIISETGKPVTCFNKFSIDAKRSIKTKNHYDLIYIPGFLGIVEDVLQKERNIITWLKKQFQNGTKLAAACNGNFLLAETGLLAKRKATTHWNLMDKFRERYKTIRVQPERIIVDEGDIISAAGVTAYFNLALFLIERYGSKELALTCSKIFLVDSGRKIQSPYEMYQFSKKHGDPEIEKTQDWLERNFNQPVTLDQLADISNLGKKTLLRRFKQATGETPLGYLKRIRIENAKRLLESKKLSFNEITWEVGYNDASSFHKLFKSETGLSPNGYRSKFSLV
jgi:transcriptional regulator GlxA family with amidase domain